MASTPLDPPPSTHRHLLPRLPSLFGTATAHIEEGPVGWVWLLAVCNEIKDIVRAPLRLRQHRSALHVAHCGHDRVSGRPLAFRVRQPRCKPVVMMMMMMGRKRGRVLNKAKGSQCVDE